MIKIYMVFTGFMPGEFAESADLTKEAGRIILSAYMKTALMGSSKRNADAKRGSGRCKLP